MATRRTRSPGCSTHRAERWRPGSREVESACVRSSAAMADLDTELSKRLSQLAAAVPVSTGLDPVHRRAVRARQQVRMAWITPLVVLVATVLAASALQIAPFVPGSTPQPTGAPEPGVSTSASTRTGDFALSIATARATYLEG